MQGSLLDEVRLPATAPGFTEVGFHWEQTWGPRGSYLRLVESSTGRLVYVVMAREVPR